MRDHTKLGAFEPADTTIDYTLAPVVVVDDDYHERVSAGKMEKNSRPAEGR